MDSEDGTIYIQKLAHFIHTHERALANALQAERRGAKHETHTNVGKSSLAHVIGRPFTALTGSKVKSAQLTLTPHHLYFLLLKFEELGVNVGNMSVRLENLRADSGPGNYVSFLGQAPPKRRAGRTAETESLRSVSSVRSVMSTVSTVWSTLGLSKNAQEKEREQEALHAENVRYLYSCFTKVPALCLSPHPTSRFIAGYEEFPFDTAVPLWVFRNLSLLEISDLDFRQMFGWDSLAKQLRSLTIKRAGIDDPLDVLYDIVLDDTDRRRRRSARAPVPTTPSTPGLQWFSTNSPKARSNHDLVRSNSLPVSPDVSNRQSSIESTIIGTPVDSAPEDTQAKISRQRTPSPKRPFTARPGSALSCYNVKSGLHVRTSSSSSGLSGLESNPRRSNSDLLGFGLLPQGSWQFLRHLSLADNGLHAISPASFVPVAHTLQSLDLSSNLFNEVPDALASLTHLRALNLSNCMIDSLRSLLHRPLPAVTTLNLRSNRLHSLAGIDKIFSLEKIDLRGNQLQDPSELARLTGMPNLTHIWVNKNPFVNTYHNHRTTIFNLFRSVPGRSEDVVLDQYGPTHTEKRKLIDWTPEARMVAVIKPIMVENVVPQDSQPSVRLIDSEDDGTVAHTPEVGVLRSRSTLQRSRTGRKQRVIELDLGGNATAGAVKQQVIPSEASDSNVKPTTLIATPDDANKDGVDTYRQEIEYLKTDLGAEWLNALAKNATGGFQAGATDASIVGDRPIPPTREISVSERTLG